MTSNLQQAMLFLGLIFTILNLSHCYLRVEQSISLPQGFVYVDEIEPIIISNLRYMTSQNFIGRPISGYFANRAILTEAAAKALKEVQRDLSEDGYRIVIYDSYRPQKAVDDFVKWATDLNDRQEKDKYYPYVDKSELFSSGYIAKRSGHTRGSTVDMSIIKDGVNLKPVEQVLREFTNKQLYFWLDDNTEDFGSSFDFFGEASHPENELVSRHYIQRRKYLTGLMEKHGFRPLDTEWWHFTLIEEPYPDQYFDFDVR